MAQHFPEVASRFPDGFAHNEKVRAISEDQVSVQVTFTRVQFEKLKRIRELLSHTNIGSTNAELLDAAMDVFLEKKDPLRKAGKPRSAPCDTAAEAKLDLSCKLNDDVDKKFRSQEIRWLVRIS